MIKSARELKRLKAQYEKELAEFNGCKGERRRIEGKLKGILKQLKELEDEDNTQ